MGTKDVESETTSLPVAKQIDIGSVLSTSHLRDLTTNLAIKEWDALLSNITTVLWGYTHIPSQHGLHNKGN